MQDRKQVIQSRVSFPSYGTFTTKLLDQCSLEFPLRVARTGSTVIAHCARIALLRLLGIKIKVLKIKYYMRHNALTFYLFIECTLHVTLCYTMKTIISKSEYTIFQSWQSISDCMINVQTTCINEFTKNVIIRSTLKCKLIFKSNL